MALMTQVGIEFIARNRAAGEMSRFRNEIGSTQRAMLGLARSTLAAFGVGGAIYMVTNLLKSSVREFANYERQLAKVSTMLDAQSMQYLPQYEQAIRKMAVTYGEAKESLTSGTYDILSAQIDAADAMKVLETAVRSAKGGFTSAAITTSATVQILKAYNLEATEAARIQDIMHATVQQGRFTFEQYASSIGDVIGLAAYLNIELEAVGASLAVMSKAGLAADTSVTALKNILNQFINPSEEAIRVAAELGFTLTETSVQGDGLIRIMEGLKGASNSQLAALMPNLRGLVGFAGQLKNAGAVATDYQKILNGAGLAEINLQKAMASASTEIDKLTQRWSALKTSMGEVIASPIISHLQKVVGVVEALKNAIEGLGDALDRYVKEHPNPAGRMEKMDQWPYFRHVTPEMESAFGRFGGGGGGDFRGRGASGEWAIEGLGGSLKTNSAAHEIVLTAEQRSADKRMAALRAQIAEEIELTGRLNEPRQHAKLLIEFQAEAAIRYADNIEQARAATASFRAELDQLERAESLARIADGIGQAFTTAFEDAILEAKNLNEVLNSLGRSIQRAFFQELVSRPLSMAISSMAGSMLGMTPATVAHGGGRVGDISARRWVDSSMFENAPRFHDLKPGETAIIAQNDEVISRPGRRPASPGPTIVNNFNMQMIDASGAKQFFRTYSREVSTAQEAAYRNNAPGRRR